MEAHGHPETMPVSSTEAPDSQVSGLGGTPACDLYAGLRYSLVCMCSSSTEEEGGILVSLLQVRGDAQRSHVPQAIQGELGFEPKSGAPQVREEFTCMSHLC